MVQSCGKSGIGSHFISFSFQTYAFLSFDMAINLSSVCMISAILFLGLSPPVAIAMLKPKKKKC